MGEKNNSNKELINVIYEQHWLHARHAENERLQLTHIYAIILAGVLAILRGKIFDLSNWPIVVLLMLLSIFGILFSIKIHSVFKAHTNAAEKILRENSLQGLSATYSKHPVNTTIRISRLFPIFFAICFAFLCWVLIYGLIPNHTIGVIIGAFVFTVLLAFSILYLYSLKYDRE